MKLQTEAIRIEGVGKKYRLGKLGAGTLSADLQAWVSRFRGKNGQDSRPLAESQHLVQNQEIWALKDVNLQIFKGEVLGIIGSNGAGKSTLLKILSRITQPTEGSLRARGRMASLLEVGTGMHPELSGRENIFLNGAILGMSRPEIDKKFDEIVAFSGCAEFIDTPIKRYSSGMKVRLGFSVAAFLEPKILIVDEVLAVGDAEFQKMAIAKMREVAQNVDRTVIFVSHNMASVKTLCTRAIVLNKGRIVFDGAVDSAISNYLGYDRQSTPRKRTWLAGVPQPASEIVKMRSAEITVHGKGDLDELNLEDALHFSVDLEIADPSTAIDCTLQIFSEDGTFIAASSSLFSVKTDNITSRNVVFRCEIPPHFFNEGFYRFGLLIVADRRNTVLRLDNLFGLTFATRSRKDDDWMGATKSLLLPQFEWTRKSL